MYNLAYKQFEMVRGYFIETVEAIPYEMAIDQPEGFNNTIHWHIGHVLTVSEKLLGSPRSTSHLPASYIELFDSGTRPAQWNGDVPDVDTLIQQLKDQLTRVHRIAPARFHESFKEPILGCHTFAELASFVIIHEGIHLGHIGAMKRVLNLTSDKTVNFPGSLMLRLPLPFFLLTGFSH